MNRPRTVTVNMPWIPNTQESTILNMANIRIEIDEDQPDRVWLWMIEDGVKVEGGSFNLDEFMDMILRFYNDNY